MVLGDESSGDTHRLETRCRELQADDPTKQLTCTCLCPRPIVSERSPVYALSAVYSAGVYDRASSGSTPAHSSTKQPGRSTGRGLCSTISPAQVPCIVVEAKSETHEDIAPLIWHAHIARIDRRDDRPVTHPIPRRPIIADPHTYAHPSDPVVRAVSRPPLCRVLEYTYRVEGHIREEGDKVHVRGGRWRRVGGCETLLQVEETYGIRLGRERRSSPH